jgi:ribonuclease G
VPEISVPAALRNLGGLIVIDFIDMDRSQPPRAVDKALVEALKNDKAKTTTVRISELGLVEMTRKRTRESLGRTLFEPCFYCDGTGTPRRSSPSATRSSGRSAARRTTSGLLKVVVNAHPAVIDTLQREEKDGLEEASAHATCAADRAAGRAATITSSSSTSAGA